MVGNFNQIVSRVSLCLIVLIEFNKTPTSPPPPTEAAFSIENHDDKDPGLAGAWALLGR